MNISGKRKNIIVKNPEAQWEKRRNVIIKNPETNTVGKKEKYNCQPCRRDRCS